jgi:hypothetical protein
MTAEVPVLIGKKPRLLRLWWLGAVMLTGPCQPVKNVVPKR